MKISETKIPGCYVVEPKVFEDDRGFFFESYHQSRVENLLGRKLTFVQDNHSVSHKGVLRGLHFQQGEKAQAKLVRVAHGEALDVVVDIRKESPAFGTHFKIRLSSENRKMLLLPRGVAHGFLSLRDNTIFVYKCDNFYDQESETGILFNDEDLAIDWEFPLDEIVLSEKDRKLQPFKEIYP